MEASKTKLFSKDDLKKLIIPLLFEQALAITVGMADTVMISSAGEAAVSGVSLIDMFNNLIIRKRNLVLPKVNLDFFIKANKVV